MIPYRKFASNSQFALYVFFLCVAILVVIIGYSSNEFNPIFLIAVGLISLYVATHSLQRSLALSTDLSTIEQVFDNQNIRIAIAYEIPPEINLPTARTRILNAAQEALDHHFSNSGSIEREDLKSVIRNAVSNIVVSEYGASAFNIRIPRIESKKTKRGVIIGHGRRS